jgi:hypothetical protein
VIIQDKIKYNCHIVKEGERFNISINGQAEITIDDTFNLSDEVLNIVLNKDQNITLQLMSKEHNGNINLQYLGTKVAKCFL